MPQASQYPLSPNSHLPPYPNKEISRAQIPAMLNQNNIKQGKFMFIVLLNGNVFNTSCNPQNFPSIFFLLLDLTLFYSPKNVTCENSKLIAIRSVLRLGLIYDFTIDVFTFCLFLITKSIIYS